MRINHFCFLVFLLILSAECFAQRDRQTDSLLQVLKTQKEDTFKVNTLNELSKRFSIKGNYDLSNKYAEDAISLAGKLNFKKGLILPYTCLGINNWQLGNYKEAMENHQAVLKISEEVGYKNGIATAYNNIGLLFADQGNSTEAIKYYLNSAKLYEQIGNKKSAANSYYNIGNTYYSPLSNFTEAVKAHTISLNLSKEVGDKNLVASRHIDIGNSYESLGNYPEAIKNYLAGLKISEETGSIGNVGSAYNNIGEIFNNQGNYSEAMKNYLAGLKSFEAAKVKDGIAISYDNIGEIYQKQGNFAEAIKYHRAALKIGEEIKYTYGIAYSYRNLGNAYFHQSNYIEALENYLSSLKLFNQIEENEGLAKINLNIGETYFRMNNFPEARKYLNQALSAAKQFHGKRIIKETYENLARLDSAAGDWEGAYRDQKLFALYRDSLINEENTNKIMENMMQYEYGKKEDSLKYHQVLTDEKLKQQTLLGQQQQQSLLFKENEVALLNNEKQLQQLKLQKNEANYAVQKAETDKKQNQVALLNKEKAIQTLQLKKQKLLKNYLLLSLGVFIILSFFVYNYYRTRQQLRLQTLRNKIASDLHDDVGSTLSSIFIFSQMAQQQSKEVIPLLDIIGESSGKMLDAMADIVWTINPENDQFEKIISRMKNFSYELLGAKKIDFEFVADDDVTKVNVPMEVRKNLYLIFKEATNNMVKYAQADKAMFSIKGEKNNLTMIIHDNGKGFDVNGSTTGNGLKNMRKRAEEIGARLVIDSLPGNGTTIEFSVAV